MTHIYRNPSSLEHDHRRGGDRFVNIWQGHAWEGVHAGDRHWTRASADKAKDRGCGPMSAPRVIYRVVVRFK